MNPFYREYSDYLAGRFDGKVQKITIDTGAMCPNRDGTLGRGGCVYCSNDAFSPGLRRGASIAAQIEDGKAFFAHKYPMMRYLAYFQSHTATYTDAERFMAQLHEASGVKDVAGIIVGTRPDCMPQPLLD
ncbi:MAG: TIGR01212 family radical SAM protein, partial [Muribaculaceae bacterium]|nr:TIGR01212 family radical SAM protein [Muribaculaceae bacterium]